MSYTNTYQRINWQNLPSEATALNDVNLNKMDAEIYAHGEQFETVDTALGHKVDKESGKGLSEIKSITISPSVNTGTKIAEISYKNQDNLTIGYEIKNGVVVDSALSSSSENPVQNKVVKSAIDAKSTVSISDTLATGDTIANLTINGTTTAIKAPLVEVDDTPSATSENPLQNKAIYEMLNNLLPEETVQGNPISIADASGLNAKACSVDLLPIQDLSHGDPSPTNICPISGRTEVSANRGSVDITTLYNGQIGSAGDFTRNNNRISNVNSAQMNTYFLKKGTHTLTFKKLNQSSPDLIECTVLTKNDNFEVVDNFATAWHSLPYTFELTADSYVYFTARKDYGTTLNTDDYKALIIDETYTETLGQTVYGGTIDLVSGSGQIKNPTCIKANTLSWQKHPGSSNNNFYYSNVVSGIYLPSVGTEVVTDLLCSHAPTSSWEVLFNTKTTGIGIATNGRICIASPDIQSLEDFNTLSPNIDICYPVATPTTLTLTPTQIDLLRGNNVISTDGDNINLVYSADIGLYIAGQLQNS